MESSDSKDRPTPPPCLRQEKSALYFWLCRSCLCLNCYTANPGYDSISEDIARSHPLICENITCQTKIVLSDISNALGLGDSVAFWREWLCWACGEKNMLCGKSPYDSDEEEEEGKDAELEEGEPICTECGYLRDSACAVFWTLGIEKSTEATDMMEERRAKSDIPKSGWEAGHWRKILTIARGVRAE